MRVPYAHQYSAISAMCLRIVDTDRRMETPDAHNTIVLLQEAKKHSPHNEHEADGHDARSAAIFACGIPRLSRSRCLAADRFLLRAAANAVVSTSSASAAKPVAVATPSRAHNSSV